MKKLSTLLIAVLVAAGLLRMCVYTVNEREYAPVSYTHLTLPTTVLV